MKKKKKTGLLIAAGVLVVLAIFLFHGRNQVLLDETDSRVLNSTFWAANPEQMDQTLKRKRYAYTTDIHKENIAVLIYRSHQAAMKQYLMDHGEEKTLTVPRDAKLVISLPVYTDSTFVWMTEDEGGEEVLKLDRQSSISIPYKPKVRVTGSGYSRRNFYFTPLKAGTRRIRFVYQQDPSIATPENSKGKSFITLSIRVQP